MTKKFLFYSLAMGVMIFAACTNAPGNGGAQQQDVRACLKNAFRQMCVTICGRLNHLTDDWQNEGRIGGKGIKGNALCNLNLA